MSKSVVFSLVAHAASAFVFPALTGTQTIINLGTFNERAYFAATEGVVLGEQPVEVEFRLEDISDGEVREVLKKTSADYQTMLRGIEQKIRSRYSVSDELQAIREGDVAYSSFVKEVIAGFAAEKARLGF